MNQYHFISEIYRLLGELDDNSLRSLENISLAPDIEPIVKAFISAKRNLPNIAKEPRVPVISSATQAAELLPSPPRSALDADLSSISIESLLSKPQAGRTNRQIVDLLRRAGLEMPYRPKESRVALVRKIKKAMQDLPMEKHDNVLRKLMQNTFVDETEGWMTVIRSNKK
jgi:hypothetical protein